MCGILGSFAFHGAPTDARRIEPHIALLRHRGPDDATCWSGGSFFFGHRRLSIIDLSQGRQPMSSHDGALVVTFNGEIYNYLELREELRAKGHAFKTHSDTEVLLNGYREWGTDLPSRLVGMFAFAIADRRERTLFMARDRFGEKPLLVCERPEGVLFASELGALTGLLPETAFNVEALPAYLCLNYVPGSETLLRGVARLEPATWRLYTSDGGSRSARYWTPPHDAVQAPSSMEEVTDTIERLLRDATRLALRSDVPVGIFLSGGIDSALVARYAAEAGHLEHAFCLTFDEASYSEWGRASVTAREIGVPLTEVRMDASAMARFLDIVSHADDPLADSSALAVWTISREAATRVKVVLSGDGGDELFGGYLTYKATAAHSAFTSRLPMPVRRMLARAGRSMPTAEGKVSGSYKLMRFLRALDRTPAEAHFTWNGVWLPEEAAALLAPDVRRAVTANGLADMIRRHGLPAHPTLLELQRADIADYLPNDILAKADRMSMAHGLEVRAPLLNPQLADYALALPPAFKVQVNGPTKRALRALARSRYGAEVADAPKQGFSIPVHQWLRESARDLVEDLLSARSIAALQVFDVAAVRGVVDAHMSGRRSLGFELWGLMVLVAWHRLHVQTHQTVLPTDPTTELRYEEVTS